MNLLRFSIKILNIFYRVSQVLPPEQTLQTGFDNLLQRVDGLLAIIVSDRDGVCLLKCTIGKSCYIFVPRVSPLLF
jgi:hypothetical protein